jgi:hypothetical protein
VAQRSEKKAGWISSRNDIVVQQEVLVVSQICELHGATKALSGNQMRRNATILVDSLIYNLVSP